MLLTEQIFFYVATSDRFAVELIPSNGGSIKKKILTNNSGGEKYQLESCVYIGASRTVPYNSTSIQSLERSFKYGGYM